MDFPIDTIEVKAEWLPLSELKAWNGVSAEDAASLYYINKARFGGEMVPVALVALHITTKLVPSWNWATFEHWKNPGRCDDEGCRDTFGAAQPVVAANKSRSTATTNARRAKACGDCSPRPASPTYG